MDLIGAMLDPGTGIDGATRALRSSFIDLAVLSAHDDDSLAGYFYRAITNFLIDQAKTSELGKLRRRLVTLLGNDARFVRQTTPRDAWVLARFGSVTWQGDIDQLHQAAASVRGVQITRWNTAGKTPKDTREALLRVAEAVLNAAGGSVADQDLARVIQYRFQLLAPPAFTQLATQGAWEPQSRTDDQPEALAETSDTAAQLWASLTPTERSVVPHLGRSPTEIAAVLELGPAAASAVAGAVAEKIRLATRDDPHRDDVVLELARLCGERP